MDPNAGSEDSHAGPRLPSGPNSKKTFHSRNRTGYSTMLIDPDSISGTGAVDNPSRVQGQREVLGGVREPTAIIRSGLPQKRHFADWIGAYLEYSKQSESPDKFHFWTGVSVIAGALRRRVVISKLTYYFEWVPNFYIIFVAPPGIVSKSTTADIGMSLLREVPGIKFGPSTVTWQALITKFAEATEEFWSSSREEYTKMSAMTLVSSELGNLMNFRDPEMIDQLVNLWDCRRGVFEKATKMSGNDSIESPWINILACTTPDWISGNVPQYVIGGGFTSRCIFVYGEQKRKYVPYPGLELGDNMRDTRRKLIEDLTMISELEGEMTLTPEAIEWGKAWYETHCKKGVDPDVAISGYMARKQTHMHKLAMILSASKSNDLIIDLPTLQRAAKLLEAAESEMPKVFAHVGQSVESRAIDLFIGRVHREGKISFMDAYRMFAKNMTKTQFLEVSNSAVATGHVRLLGAGSAAVFAAGAPLPGTGGITL